MNKRLQDFFGELEIMLAFFDYNDLRAVTFGFDRLIDLWHANPTIIYTNHN